MRKKTPEEKKLTGTYRPDREPKPVEVTGVLTECPEPPQRIITRPFASEIWRNVTMFLVDERLLNAVDLNQLGAYCLNLETYYQMMEILHAEGMTTTSAKGEVRSRPEVKIANDCLDIATKIGKLFYITPLARVSIPPKPEDPDKDLESSYLNDEEAWQYRDFEEWKQYHDGNPFHDLDAEYQFKEKNRLSESDYRKATDKDNFPDYDSWLKDRINKRNHNH